MEEGIKSLEYQTLSPRLSAWRVVVAGLLFAVAFVSIGLGMAWGVLYLLIWMMPVDGPTFRDFWHVWLQGMALVVAGVACSTLAGRLLKSPHVQFGIFIGAITLACLLFFLFLVGVGRLESFAAAVAVFLPTPVCIVLISAPWRMLWRGLTRARAVIVSNQFEQGSPEVAPPYDQRPRSRNS